MSDSQQHSEAVLANTVKPTRSLMKRWNTYGYNSKKPSVFDLSHLAPQEFKEGVETPHPVGQHCTHARLVFARIWEQETDTNSMLRKEYLHRPIKYLMMNDGSGTLVEDAPSHND